jgi:ATP-dependent Clp protease protease subunit
MDIDYELVQIHGNINSDKVESVSERIHELEVRGVRNATLEINSRGGKAQAGFALNNRVEASTIIFQVLVLQLCRSAAMMSLLSVPVERRYCYPTSQFMDHPAKHELSGLWSVAELERQILLTRAIDDLTLDIYEANTALSREQAYDIFIKSGQDVHFNAEQARSWGIIGHIIGQEDRPAISRQTATGSIVEISRGIARGSK